MDYSAVNRGLWEFVITLGIMSLSLGVALVLRNRFRFIRRSMMPTAVLAGFLLLIARETGLIRLNMEILETLVYHSIAMGFIAMSLRKRSARSERTESGKGASQASSPERSSSAPT